MCTLKIWKKNVYIFFSFCSWKLLISSTTKSEVVTRLKKGVKQVPVVQIFKEKLEMQQKTERKKEKVKKQL